MKAFNPASRAANFSACGLVLAACVLLFSSTSSHADSGSDLQHLQQRWAEINYQLEGKIQLSSFVQLIADADAVIAGHPDSAEALIWRGIIKSSYAKVKGGLGALSLAKAAKIDLERAISIDPLALHGSAYASLGELYSRTPGWPFSFGNNGKARELLSLALSLNPDDGDCNYFYGIFLIDEARYEEARGYLLKAQQATPRPGHALADTGRQREIAAALLAINGK